jgi:hypothetical protein
VRGGVPIGGRLRIRNPYFASATRQRHARRIASMVESVQRPSSKYE